jgi:hypothetical protein
MSQCLECQKPFLTSQAKIGITWLTRDICEACRAKAELIPDRPCVTNLVGNTTGHAAS